MRASKIAGMAMKSMPIPLSKYTGIFQSRPVVCNFYITELCNLRCEMCDIWKRADPKSELDMDGLRDMLKQLKGIGVQLIGITGGEPLLKKGIFDFVKEAKSMGFVVHINSNGTLITDERKALDIIGSGVDSYTISLDGLKKTHDGIRNVPGTFERALKGIKNLVNARKKSGAKMRIGISTVIMKRNIGEIKELTLMVRKMGVDAIAFQPFSVGFMDDERAKIEHMIAAKQDKKRLDDLIRWLADFKRKTGFIGNSYGFLKLIPTYFTGGKMPSCFAGYFNIDIDSKGNVYPCIAMGKVGNIKESALKEIWHNKGYSAFRKNIVPKCQKCFLGCYGEPSLLYNPIFLLSSLKNVVSKLKPIK